MTFHLTFNGLWQTTKYIAFLGRELPVHFVSEQDDQPPTPRQIAVLDSLDQVTPDIVPQLAQWVQHDLQDRLARWGITLEEMQEELGIEIDVDDLQKHFAINEILIPRIGDCRTTFVVLQGACEWDSEHGIEFLLKDGRPILCGPQEGLALSAEWDDYLIEG